MEPMHIPSSIMFKHMLEQNKGLAGKTSRGRPHMAALLDDVPLVREDRLALVTFEAADFHLKFAGIGVETGRACLRACLDAAVDRFAACFPGCTLLFIQEASPGDAVFLFEHAAGDRSELFYCYLAYRAAVLAAVAATVDDPAGDA
nr:hypothetical protein [Solidesulfovibrio sp.]